MNTMIDPTITCPNCKTEIKLTESLAAPLIESIRTQYEERIAAQETAVATREAVVRDQLAEVAKAKETVDEQVAQKLKEEREGIAAEEARKARVLLGGDLEIKTKELAEL